MLPELMKKYTEGYGERRGGYSPEKLEILGGRRPLWIHAVSVGEVQAAVPLIRAARADGFDAPVVLSTTTETGKAMALQLGGGAFDLHIYYPWDKREFVRSSLEAIRPLAFVTMETELWPNMLWELRDRKIPSFLANGRVSGRTYKKLRGVAGRKAGREVFGLFSELYLREEEDRKRLLRLGIAGEKLAVTGDGKIDALLSRKESGSGNVRELAALLDAGRAPVFIAGSTHTGEDAVVIDAFLELKRQEPDVRLIIAPRHPERAGSVMALLPSDIKTYLFSELGSDWECLIVDKIGCLFGLYSLAAAAFVGGSLVKKGGQNILEPAVWGVPLQHGPYMDDFAGASGELIDMGIARVAENAGQLAGIWLDILRDGKAREEYRQRCGAYFEKKAGASRRVWSGIKAYLES